ncbi:NUDIX domain-containing protein [Candidatus Saccharibacteria bacterium]|nr:NUDIX domain-containing protein [Candidatus Saccharibacteria bacterium]
MTVTLSVRGIEPHKGMLDSFGGFVDVEESYEDAVYRELHEELGIEKHEYTNPVYLRSAVGHYSYESETLTVVSNFYWIELIGMAKLVAGDDVENTVTIPLGEVELSKLHDDDVRAGIIELLKQLEASK